LPPEDVADLTQEVFVRLLQYVRQRDISRPQAFIFVTASNLSKDFARRRLTRSALRHVSLDGLDDEAAMVSSLPLPDAACESFENLNLLNAAVAELRPKCRHCLVSSRMHDTPYVDIASELGISKSMVEKHVNRGLAHCRERLSRPT
jgi:RNA polymerase sigma-70 factor (ECF subfamily)